MRAHITSLWLLLSGCAAERNDLHLLFRRWEVDVPHASLDAAAEVAAATARSADGAERAQGVYAEQLAATVRAGVDAHETLHDWGMVGAGTTIDTGIVAALAHARRGEVAEGAAVVDAALLLSSSHAVHAELMSRDRMGYDRAFGYSGVWFDGTGELGVAARAAERDADLVAAMSDAFHVAFDAVRGGTNERAASRLGPSVAFDEAVVQLDHALLRTLVLDATNELVAAPNQTGSVARARVVWEALRGPLGAVDPDAVSVLEAALYPAGAPGRCRRGDPVSSCTGAYWLDGLDAVDGASLAPLLDAAVTHAVGTGAEGQ